MNYLAHIYLSGEDDQYKIGNFIADSVKGKKFTHFPEKIQQGIVLHRAIDTYTDTHPVVKQSKHRLFSRYSHYSSVIVDILYDHFLASNWRQFSPTPLDEYVEDFYQLLDNNHDILPKRVQQFLPYMKEDNWLLNYSSVSGIDKILKQMNVRTKGKSGMDTAAEELQLYYKEFEDEFFAFFRDLDEFAKKSVTKLSK